MDITTKQLFLHLSLRELVEDKVEGLWEAEK